MTQMEGAIQHNELGVMNEYTLQSKMSLPSTDHKGMTIEEADRDPTDVEDR